MPSNNYSGKPYPRHYAPAAPRVFPNGTQSISVYTAPLVFYDNAANAYSTSLGNRPNGDTGYYLLLFGTDYPASVCGYVKNTNCLNSNGDPITPSIVTQNIGYDGISGGSVNYFPGFQSFETKTGKYQQIIKGTTVTNNVEISGFAGSIGVPFNDVWNTAQIGIAPANQEVAINALMNGVSGAATSVFGEVDFSLLTFKFRFPVIMWEYDFKPFMKESNFVFDANFTPIQGGEIPVTLDIVGIWSGDPPYALSSPAPLAAPPDAPLAAPLAAPVLPRLPWTRR